MTISATVHEPHVINLAMVQKNDIANFVNGIFK